MIDNIEQWKRHGYSLPRDKLGGPNLTCIEGLQGI